MGKIILLNKEGYRGEKVKDNECHEVLDFDLKKVRFELRVWIFYYNYFIDYSNSCI